MKLNNPQAHIFIFLANLIYAGNYTIAKEVMPLYILPFGFILLRVSFATILFWIILLFTKPQKIDKKDYLRLFLCGMFGVATNQLLFFKGLNLTSPIHAALIMMITPILVLIISLLAQKEKIKTHKLLGMGLGLFGAFYLIVQGKQTDAGSNPMLGDILVLLNASSYGIYLVLVKSLLEKYNALTVVSWVFSFGLLLVTPFGFSELNAVQWQQFNSSIWLAVFYVLFCVTFLTYLFNAAALSKVSPFVVSIYIYLQPILASFIAIAAQKDSFNTTKAIATVFVFSGVYLVSFYKKTSNST